MKPENDLDGSYINDALKCSSLDISTVSKNDTNEPHAGHKGSNEYIRKYLFAIYTLNNIVC